MHNEANQPAQPEDGDVERPWAIQGRTPSRVWQQLKPLAREMRHEPTEAEATLWQALRGRRLAGLRFRRQHALGPYIVDLYCAELGLVIEVDGGVHAQQQENDRVRQDWLVASGLSVLRFDNERVLQALPSVLEEIERAAEGLRAVGA